MSQANITQNPPLGTMNIEPYDVWYADTGEARSEGGAGGVNIPWLLSLSLAIGNATTQAIDMNAIVCCEPEWGFDMTGAGKGSLYGNGGEGGGTGGLYVGW